MHAPPDTIAVIAHEGEASRLALIDVGRARVRYADIGAEGATDPVFSPDGARIALRAGRALFLHDVASGVTRAVPGVLDLGPSSPYVFSPDGRRLAVAFTKRVEILTLESGRGLQSHGAHVALDEGARVDSLLWSPAPPTQATLLVLQSRPGGSEGSRLVSIDAEGLTTSARIITGHDGGDPQTPGPAGCGRLLGFRPNGDLLVCRTRGAGEEVCVLPASGPPTVVRPVEENLFVLTYVSAADTLVMIEGSEDMGDAVSLKFAAPRPTPSRPWLSDRTKLRDLRPSADGRWAMFIERPAGEAGGDVYRVAFGEEGAERVLSATPARSYACATLKPVVA